MYGELLSIAEKAGAKLVDMREIQCNLGPPQGLARRTTFHLDVTHYILVNNEGLVKCVWQFDVSSDFEANVIMMHKGDTALLAAVNEALAKAYDSGFYAGWYEEAKAMAGLETAEEVSIPDETAEEAPAEEAAEEAAAESAAG